VIKELWDSRYQIEGDIHVWPDDHVDWDGIKKILAAAGFEVLMLEDYLLYKRGCPIETYSRYERLCSDERLLAARKLSKSDNHYSRTPRLWREQCWSCPPLTFNWTGNYLTIKPVGAAGGVVSEDAPIT